MIEKILKNKVISVDSFSYRDFIDGKYNCLEIKKDDDRFEVVKLDCFSMFLSMYYKRFSHTISKDNINKYYRCED